MQTHRAHRPRAAPSPKRFWNSTCIFRNLAHCIRRISSAAQGHAARTTTLLLFPLRKRKVSDFFWFVVLFVRCCRVCVCFSDHPRVLVREEHLSARMCQESSMQQYLTQPCVLFIYAILVRGSMACSRRWLVCCANIGKPPAQLTTMFACPLFLKRQKR